jgi:hypothetical protein
MEKAKKRRKTAVDIVKESASSNVRGLKWTELLCAADQRFVRSIVAEMRGTPGAAPYVVAKGVKEELRLTVCIGTIAKTLKELIADDQAKTK